MSKTYRVEVSVPCVEVFVYEVEADNIADARQIATEGGADPVSYTTEGHDVERAEAYISEAEGV
jgi:hypothetical protein